MELEIFVLDESKSLLQYTFRTGNRGRQPLEKRGARASGGPRGLDRLTVRKSPSHRAGVGQVRGRAAVRGPH